MKTNLNTLRIAIQKNGRLTQDSINLLMTMGILIDIQKRKLIIKSLNENVEIIFLRNESIASYVEQGICDIGITGENTILEKQSQVKIIKKLNYGKCRFSIAIPKKLKIRTINDLNGVKIATSFPNILKRFLDEKNIKAKIIEISGGVEIAPIIGISDVIADLVATGSTLRANGLIEFVEILQSESVLIQTKKLINKEKQDLINKIFKI